MPEQFLVYQKFTHQSEAEEVLQLLRAQDIPYQLEGTKLPFDPTFAFTSYEPELELKIQKTDFEKADTALNMHYEEMTGKVPSDYYLYNFSDEELQDVIHKKDEWGRFDYVFAKKLLADRGSVVTVPVEQAIALERLAELKRPLRLGIYWIVIGYVLAVVGSLIGFFMALTIIVFRKTLPNGDLIYRYDKYSRNHATAIMIISASLLLLRVLFQIPLFYEVFIPLG